MKYIFLTGSIIFGITGISQAMDAFKTDGFNVMLEHPVIFKLQHISISFQTTPGFAKIIFLSLGFFVLYLIRQRLKDLGLNTIKDYIPS